MIGIIYMLFDSNKDEKTCYIGSTTKNLEERKKQHINAFRAYTKGQANFYSVFNIFLNCQMVFDTIEIKEIEKIEINNEIELKLIEEECITKFKISGYNIVNLNKAINKKTYKKNKCYRDFYKNTGKKCKLILKCPCCSKDLKISISAMSEHFFDDCEYFTDED